MSVTIRQIAPAFSLNGAQGNDTVPTSRRPIQNGKWVILLFFPMDWTFVCPTELLAYNDAKEKLAAVNAVVLGISGDSPFTT